ncbi:MAG: nickel transporter permease [Methanotrichaceae archaeon]
MKLEIDLKIALAAILVVLLAAIAIFPGLFAPHNPEEVRPAHRLISPSLVYPLGTDHLGRCILSRVVFGARTSLMIGISVVLLSALIGIILGCTAGYLGGFVDEIIMRIVDAFLAFPSMFLTLAIVGFLGAGLANMMISLILVEWTGFARLVRGTIISLKGREFLEAATSLGASDFYIVYRHIMPNIIPPLAVMATLGVGYAILGAASLSFLGLGIQPPTPEWGSMMSDGRPFVRAAPWIMIFPGLSITIAVLAFNLLGESLRDRMDPRAEERIKAL